MYLSLLLPNVKLTPRTISIMIFLFTKAFYYRSFARSAWNTKWYKSFVYKVINITLKSIHVEIRWYQSIIIAALHKCMLKLKSNVVVFNNWVAEYYLILLCAVVISSQNEIVFCYCPNHFVNLSHSSDNCKILNRELYKFVEYVKRGRWLVALMHWFCTLWSSRILVFRPSL